MILSKLCYVYSTALLPIPILDVETLHSSPSKPCLSLSLSVCHANPVLVRALGCCVGS